MMSRILATANNGGLIAPGALPHGDPDPQGLGSCDRCAAWGLVHVEHDAQTLVLCGHHYVRFWAALYAAGWEVTRDTRAELMPLRPSVPVIPGKEGS